MIVGRKVWSFPAFCRFASSKSTMTEASVFRKNVSFRAENGKDVKVEAVYEDSLSAGSYVGTVVAFHGSPGSHNDFKYIRNRLDQNGIRFIGVNYPGFKQTPGYSGQQHSNAERQSYSNALLKELEIEKAGKVIFMAHSRGCENALMTATSFKADGLVMMNPVGLRIHKSLRPLSRLQRIESTYNMLPKFLGDAMIYKLQDGEEAINALQSVIRCGLGSTLPFIHKLNEQEKTKLFIMFAGKDIIVEEEIIFEALKEYKGLQHFNYETEIEDQKGILKTFDSQKGASVFVAKDTHYQNKKRADLVADVVIKMLKVTESSENDSKLSKNKI